MPVAGGCSGVRENWVIWVTSSLGGTVGDEEKMFSRVGQERACRGHHHVCDLSWGIEEALSEFVGSG